MAESSTAHYEAASAPPPYRLDRREIAGSLADLGVLVPIVVALITVNGLSPTAVLLPAGLLYVAAGAIYRVPIPVQPLKAFGAIAIAAGLGSAEIGAGAILMGGVFVLLGATGLIDAAARFFPRPLVRGVQLSVGLLLIKLAYGLLAQPPAGFADAALPTPLLIGAAVVVGVVAYRWRARGVMSALVGLAVVVIVARFDGPVHLGPAGIAPPALSPATFAVAAGTLVLPQLPLTFANSCVATADAARGYFGPAAGRVTAGRLATTLGVANLCAGAIGGMPVCHGAGGLTAHRSFGARSGAAPMLIGSALVVLAVAFGAAVAPALQDFPLPILAALLAVAGVLHVGLLADLRGRREWAFAVAAGVVGFVGNLAVALVIGLLGWHLWARLGPRLS